jgi:hypothetical protein
LDVHERFGSWCQSRPKGVYYTLALLKFMENFATLNGALVAEWLTRRDRERAVILHHGTFPFHQESSLRVQICFLKKDRVFDSVFHLHGWPHNRIIGAQIDMDWVGVPSGEPSQRLEDFWQKKSFNTSYLEESFLSLLGAIFNHKYPIKVKSFFFSFTSLFFRF